MCGITLFLYQTLDAVDGKQARRTRSSSALGQLFDHGCDALSTLIGALSLCVCLQLGQQRSLTFNAVTCAAFFVAQWNEYHTHVLSTNVLGLFGVTEAQVCGVCVVCVWCVCTKCSVKTVGLRECDLRVFGRARVWSCACCADDVVQILHVPGRTHGGRSVSTCSSESRCPVCVSQFLSACVRIGTITSSSRTLAGCLVDACAADRLRCCRCDCRCCRW